MNHKFPSFGALRAISNLETLSCEADANHIRNIILPHIYNTYLEDNQQHNNHPKTIEFLDEFRIKNI